MSFSSSWFLQPHHDDYTLPHFPASSLVLCCEPWRFRPERKWLVPQKKQHVSLNEKGNLKLWSSGTPRSSSVWLFLDLSRTVVFYCYSSCLLFEFIHICIYIYIQRERDRYIIYNCAMYIFVNCFGPMLTQVPNNLPQLQVKSWWLCPATLPSFKPRLLWWATTFQA